ncbi:hypothetical protein KR222_000646 [Zaprionus bogoriensis]|nr:hypothetical protein KR222_000646 [Zaprionus bogoriensis]
MDISVALLKPHILRNTYALQQIKVLIGNNFNVLGAKEVHITKEISERFYAEHKGKFFYHRLTSFMNSGPCYAFILQSEECIQKWRCLMGPTKVFRAVYSEPDCIRALYGLSDTRNACHGSDSKESALREIAILFPEFDCRQLRQPLSNENAGQPNS